MTNKQRIEHARHAVAASCFARGEAIAYGEDAVTELLTDLQHFCAARGLDYRRCARMAAMHFDAEREGGAS